ncbi:MAG TPA: hypothetical protein VHG92_03460 [Afifellaceae bacterium]|nr:hypothetical protein [Afifellaceae bacterium]
MRAAIALLLGAGVALASPASAQQAAADWGDVPANMGAIVVILGDGMAGGTLVVGDADGQLDEAMLGERARKALQYRLEPGTYAIHVEGREPFEWVADPNDPLFLWIGTEPRPPIQAVRGVRGGDIDAPDPLAIAPAGKVLRFTVER